jgi:hypothetical protein
MYSALMAEIAWESSVKISENILLSLMCVIFDL